MYIIIDTEIDNEAIKYTFKLLIDNFLGIPFEFKNQSSIKSISKNKITIYYGYKKNCTVNYNLKIYCSEFWTKKNYLKKHSLPITPLLRYSDEILKDIIGAEELPILYLGLDSENNSPYTNFNSDENIVTNIDFIASSFFMLSRYEEVVNPMCDEFDRYPAEESIAYKEQFLSRPIVNEYVELLWYWLKTLDSNLVRKKRKFELILTHDIDNIRSCNFSERIRSIFRQIIRRKSLIRFLEVLWLNFAWIFVMRKNAIDYIIHNSKAFGIKPRFYFITNGTSKFDKRYDPNSPMVLKLFEKIKSEGFEVGLHASYSSYSDIEQLSKEKKMLEEILGTDVIGVRNHYLRIKVPESLRNFGKVNFSYDSSLGYSKRYGYRTGTCYPFNFYDMIEDKELKLVEYPLIIMDTTLYGNYPKLNTPNKIFQVIKEQIDIISYFGGTAVLLIHKTSLEHFEFPWRRIYLKILNYCKKKKLINENHLD